MFRQLDFIIVAGIPNVKSTLLYIHSTNFLTLSPKPETLLSKHRASTSEGLREVLRGGGGVGVGGVQGGR